MSSLTAEDTKHTEKRANPVKLAGSMTLTLLIDPVDLFPLTLCYVVHDALGILSYRFSRISGSVPY